MRKLPNPRRILKLDFDAHEFLVSTHAYLTPLEVGKLVDDLATACTRGDVDYVRSFSFVRKVHFEPEGREAIPLFVRRMILARGVCALCGSKENLTVDHIRPVSENGTNEVWNLQCLCSPCNRKKGPQAWSRRRRKETT